VVAEPQGSTQLILKPTTGDDLKPDPSQIQVYDYPANTRLPA